MFAKLRHKAAEKLVGGRIIKSVPNISISDDIKLLLKSSPHILRLDSPDKLEKEYRENPVLSSVVNLKAEYASNAKVNVRNIKNGEIITDKDFRQSKSLDPVVKNMFKLKLNPNPLQSTKEFQALGSIFKDVFGNAYIYANGTSDDITIKDVGFLWYVWPQYMKPILTGKYFDQTSIDGILKLWEWKRDNYEKKFKTSEILHRKVSNIKLDTPEDFILGESLQVSLAWALANIKIAYESRNVIARERGMRAIIGSNKSDGFTGNIPMDEEEKKEVQSDLKTNYGLMDGQDQFMVTSHAITVHNVDQDVRKLGLLNEISSDAMVVCNKFGVPYNLLKMDLKGTTYENQAGDERRMYQDTVMPEEEDRWGDITNWLKCRDFGYEYVVSFDHLPALQENFKDRAETDKHINSIYKDLFLSGAIILNQWLIALRLPTVEWGNRRITEMSFEEIQKIKGNFSINDSLDNPNNNNNGNQEEN